MKHAQHDLYHTGQIALLKRAPHTACEDWVRKLAETAEYWISDTRDHALGLACRRRGFSATKGRGFDNLPLDVRARLQGALVRSLEHDELLRALGAVIAGLFSEVDEVQELAVKVESQLHHLTVAWDG